MFIVFSKCGNYLAVFHFVGGAPPPLRANGINLVAEVDHFCLGMIHTSHNWDISDFDDDPLYVLGKVYQVPTVDAKCSF